MVENKPTNDAGYAGVTPQEVFIDGGDNIVTQEDLAITPFQVIKTLAEQMGHEICDPNPSCKKCNGTGIIGRHADNKAPIPCKCIQPNFDSVENQTMYDRTRKYNRKERRQMEKAQRKSKR